jgi:hypothetical protein
VASPVRGPDESIDLGCCGSASKLTSREGLQKPQPPEPRIRKHKTSCKTLSQGWAPKSVSPFPNRRDKVACTPTPTGGMQLRVQLASMIFSGFERCKTRATYTKDISL